MRAAPFGARAIGLAFLLSASHARAEPLGGFLHILGPTARVSIEIDGQARASAEDDRGLVLRDVPPGVHRVRAALAGHVDQLQLVTVALAETTTVRLRPWVPVLGEAPVRGPALGEAPGRGAALGEASAPTPTGSVWIEALDLEATLDSAPLGWRKIALGGQPFVAPSVPAGPQKLTFCNPDKCLDFRVTIPAKETLALVVDFGPTAVHDVSSERRAAWAQARAACESQSSVEACARACNAELALTLGARSGSCERLERGAAPEAVLAQSASAGPSVPVAPAPPTERPTAVSTERRTLPCLPLAGTRQGQVSLRSRARAEVFHGATRLGTTPLERVALPAGCVELRLVVDRRHETRLMVEVDPEKPAIYEVELPPPPLAR